MDYAFTAGVSQGENGIQNASPMSRNNILKTLGLFVVPRCLENHLCHKVVRAMLVAPGAPASVYVSDNDSAVKPEARKTVSVDLPADLDLIVRERIEARRADLARHFDGDRPR